MADDCPGLSNRYWEDCKEHGHWTNDKHCPKQRQRNLKATGVLGGKDLATGVSARGASSTRVPARGASVRNGSSTVRSSTGVSARGASFRVGSSTGVASKRKERPTMPTKRYKADHIPRGSKGPKAGLERNQTDTAIDDKQSLVHSLGNNADTRDNLATRDQEISRLRSEKEQLQPDNAKFQGQIQGPTSNLPRGDDRVIDCVGDGLLCDAQYLSPSSF